MECVCAPVGCGDWCAFECERRTGAVSGMKGWLAFGACRKPSIVQSADLGRKQSLIGLSYLPRKDERGVLFDIVSNPVTTLIPMLLGDALFATGTN